MTTVDEECSASVRLLLYEAYVGRATGNIRYISTIVRILTGRGVHTTVVVPTESPLDSLVREGGGEVVQLAPPARLRRHAGALVQEGPLQRLLTLGAMAGYWARLGQLIADRRAQVVQCHNLRSLLTVGPPAKMLGIPTLWYVKGDIEGGELARVGERIADRILFQTKRFAAREYNRMNLSHHERVRIVPNGIDWRRIEAVECADARPPDILHQSGLERRVGFFGMITPNKGVDLLLDAMRPVWDRFSGAALYIVGDEGMAENRAFMQALECRAAETNTYFLGWREDALDIMRLMDIVVLPSRSEGVPRTLIEAMALRRPVVATDVGGVSDLVVPGCGLVVPPDDREALASAIIEILSDEALQNRLAEAGRRHVQRNHLIERNIDALQSVYAELVGRR